MDIKRAKELLEILSDGVNPITGEVLPPYDSCNQIEIVRALNLAVRILNEKQEKGKQSRPYNQGKPWLKKDEEKLCEMFDEGYTKVEICRYFDRTPGAIAAKLVRLGKIDERKEFR